MWWGPPCDTKSNMCQRSTRQRIHAAKEARLMMVNGQILWHKAIRLVSAACCQDAVVAAATKHAHYSLPQSVLQTCVGEQALQKLQSGTFVIQAFIWFIHPIKSFGPPCLHATSCADDKHQLTVYACHHCRSVSCASAQPTRLRKVCLKKISRK